MTIYRSKIEERRLSDRRWPMVPIRGEDGRMMKGHRILCAECGAVAEVKRSNMTPDMQFKKIGWEVGNNENHDYCPACIAARGAKGKVIHMAEHTNKQVQPAPVSAAPVEVSREDGRLISRAIEDHWDERNGCYQIGWSDVKQAADLSVDVAWVKAIRERDFGGTGEDPTIQAFIAEQVNVRHEIGGLTTQIGLVAEKLKSAAAIQIEMDKQLTGYLNGHRRLLDRVEALEQIAEKVKKG